MTRKRVWRYYCGFCRRSGCSGGHIAAHERGCTANPDRLCGYCKAAHLDQKPISDLIAALTGQDGNLEAGIKAVRDMAEACPACMLAAIRQSAVQKQTTRYGEGEGEWEYIHVPFDFKAESASFWREVNGARVEADERGYSY